MLLIGFLGATLNWNNVTHIGFTRNMVTETFTLVANMVNGAEIALSAGLTLPERDSLLKFCRDAIVNNEGVFDFGLSLNLMRTAFREEETCSNSTTTNNAS